MKKLLLFLVMFSLVNIARAQTTHSVTITFTPSTSVGSGTAGIGYNLYRGTTAGAESTTPLNATPFVCSTACQFINAANLVEGTTYYYTIKTVDLTSNAISVASNEVSATIPKTVIVMLPPVVTGATAQ